MIKNTLRMKVGQLRLVDEARLHEQIVAWNQTAVPYRSDRCIHELVEERVRATPDAPAVVFEGTTLSYARLNALANQLAHRLRAAGTGPGARVGVAVLPSLERIVALLGVLKSGAAYLPLEVGHPDERLRWLMEDAGIAALVVTPATQGRFADSPVPMLQVHAEDGGDERDPEVIGTSRDVAYVIYTSGSTGRPKGVLIEHHSLVNRLAWMQGEYDVTPADSILHKTSFGFDVSVWELFLPLITGARMVVAPDGAQRDARTLVELIRREGVTLLHFVPSLLEAFLENDGVEACTSIRAVICSGEALSRPLARRFHERLSCGLHNLYGPTEATIDVTHWACAPESHLPFVPIGHPVANTRVYVLDERMEPVPVGAEGELHLGGVQVARGYLNRPALTAEKFVPDPFGEGSGGRLYRTGDRVRFLHDGALEFLGRLDGQVKVRGFRIELGEIESALVEHPEVRSAAVLLREDAPGRKRLVAYVVWRGAGSAAEGTERVRAGLARRLPEYMVPDTIVSLDALPLNSSGKLDRGALPAPERGAGARPQVEPRNEAERRIAEVWCELLSVPSAGVDDHFFRVGGDSILSIRLVARARKRGIHFEVKDVFESPTIAGLAAVARFEEAPLAVDAAEGPLTGPVPLAPSQRILLGTLRGGEAVCAAVAPAGALDAGFLEAALQEVVRHHDALRLRLRSTAGGAWEQVYAAPGEAGDAPVEVREAESEDWEAVLAAEAVRIAAMLSVEHGPAVRAALVRSAGGGERLLLAAHPLVLDQASWTVLIDDLESAYLQVVGGSAVRLPEKARSYRDWSRAVQLPAGCADGGCAVAPEPEASVAPAALLRMKVGDEVSRLLLGGAGRAYRASPAEVVAAAVVQALRGEAGAVRLHRARDGRAGAHGLDLERTVGCFTTVQATVLAPERSDDPGRILKSVKEQLRAPAVEDGAAAPGVELRWVDDPGSGPGRLLRTAPEWFDPAPSAPTLPRTAVRVTCLVVAGSLHAEFRSLDGGMDEARLRAAAGTFQSWLETLVRYCAGSGAFGYTPSDFPLAGLGQEVLDAVFARLPGVADAYPLAPMQDGMLFRGLYWPGSDSYFNQNVLELRGALDAGALRAAWTHVANRYSILKTGFVWEGLDEPLQYVLDHVEAPWEEHDWQAAPVAAHRDRLEVLLREDRDRGLHLSQVPLFRLQLVRLAPDHFYLLWSHHHILLDGWCLSLIWGDVFQAYAALVGGEVPQLPPTRPFRGYIEWLQAREVTGASARFWKEYLDGFDEVTRFSPVHGHLEAEFDTREMRLSAESTAALAAFAQQCGVTVNAIVQAVWSLMLGVHSGRDDVIHGMTIAGRPAELDGVEQMVGLFINTIPLRVRLNGDDTVAELLQQIQTTMARANEHGHVPLARIKSWCRASGQHGAAIFDSLIAFENYPEDNLPVGVIAGVDVRDLKAVEKTEYPLGLIVLPGDELIFHVNYDTGHFDIPSIERIESQLRTLLEQLPRRPGARLRDLTVLSGPERQRMLVEWNDTAVSWPRTGTLHELFEVQAAETPEREAVRDGGVSWTYRELNRRSNRLAASLVAQGVRPGDAVALCLDRSAEHAAAMLGALKAGARVVPVDPVHPAARRALILRDTGARVIVSARGAGEEVEGMHTVRVDDTAPDATWDRNPESGVREEDVAFVIYTSGSTGTPKGVLCPHAGMVNRILWSREAYPVAAPVRLLQNAGVGFDISVWEVFFPLLSGGALVVAPAGRNRDMDWLVQTIMEERINVVHFVPSLFEVFLSHAQAARCTGIEQVVCGGEALTLRQRRAFAAMGLGARLHHAYGPTEASVSVAHWECRPADHPERVPIGRPIANTRLYVLDPERRPVPVGVEGELYVGGACLASGYHNDTALTTERFVDDPFVPGERMYRTGDRGRFLADGCVEFLGRRDNQVKLRGHRIELGEVDAVLALHPAVHQAVTLCVETAAGEKQLVAYVVPGANGSGAVERAALEQWLGERLPTWMVPADVVVLKALPLTVNGKVDRAALAATHRGGRPARADYAPPRNERETILARIWEELLGVSPIGIHDNFFDLGGHSLLLMRMVTRVQQAFPAGVHCDISQIFKAPTVAELAERMTGTVNGRAGTAVLTLRPVGARTPLFLVHPGEGLAVAYSALVPHLPDRPVFAINNPRFGDARRAFRSIEEMAAAYVELMREVEPRGPYVLGGWSFGGVVALEMAARLAEAGETVEMLVMIDSYNFAPRAGAVVDRAGIRERVAARGIDPDSTDGRALCLEIENNGSLAERYTPPRYGGRMVLLQAADGDPHDPVRAEPARNGWDPAVFSRLEVERVPGEHVRLLDAEYVGEVGGAMCRVLEDASPGVCRVSEVRP